MSVTPPAATENKQRKLGTRFLLIALGLFAAGLLIILLVEDGTPWGIGVALMSLASVPAVAGVGLLGIALVARRSRQGKPWA